MVNGSGGKEKKGDDAGGEAEAMKPAPEMTALQKINLRALKRSSRKPTAGLTMPDSNWRRDMAAETTQRSQPKVRSIGMMRTPKPWK
jgi:hypothetical protein